MSSRCHRTESRSSPLIRWRRARRDRTLSPVDGRRRRRSPRIAASPARRCARRRGRYQRKQRAPGGKEGRIGHARSSRQCRQDDREGGHLQSPWVEQREKAVLLQSRHQNQPVYWPRICGAGSAVAKRLLRFQRMRLALKALVASCALLFLACALASSRAAGTRAENEPVVDAAPCLGAIAAAADDKIITDCGALIDNDKAARADRIKALTARGGALARQGQAGRAITDYDALLQLDPTLADVFNARGELHWKQEDRPHALADFSAALRLDPNHPAAKDNYRRLALELERLGAMMAVKGQPSFNCATARRAIEKTICANPDLADLDREIMAVNTGLMRARQGASRALCATSCVSRMSLSRAQRLLWKAGLRPCDSDARAAGPSPVDAAAIAERRACLGLNRRHIPRTMPQKWRPIDPDHGPRRPVPVRSGQDQAGDETP